MPETSLSTAKQVLASNMAESDKRIVLSGLLKKAIKKNKKQPSEKTGKAIYHYKTALRVLHIPNYEKPKTSGAKTIFWG